MTDLSDPKKNAALLKSILLETFNINAPHTNCLQIISKLAGYRNWQTYSACYAKKETKINYTSQQEADNRMLRYEAIDPIVLQTGMKLVLEFCEGITGHKIDVNKDKSGVAKSLKINFDPHIAMLIQERSSYKFDGNSIDSLCSGDSDYEKEKAGVYFGLLVANIIHHSRLNLAPAATKKSTYPSMRFERAYKMYAHPRLQKLYTLWTQEKIFSQEDQVHDITKFFADAKRVLGEEYHIKLETNLMKILHDDNEIATFIFKQYD